MSKVFNPSLYWNFRLVQARFFEDEEPVCWFARTYYDVNTDSPCFVTDMDEDLYFTEKSPIKHGKRLLRDMSKALTKPIIDVTNGNGLSDEINIQLFEFTLKVNIPHEDEVKEIYNEILNLFKQE